MGGGPAKDQLLIILPQPEPVDAVEQLRHKFPQIDIVYHQSTFTFDPDALAAQLPPTVWDNANLLFTLATFPKTPSQAPHLTFIQLMSAGSNQIQKNPLYTSTTIPIATATGVHGPQIAEWVIMTALVASHGYRTFYEQQKRHDWNRGDPLGDIVRDRAGLRVGVLGYGSIGRQVGRVAHAMGMRVLAYTASKKDTAEKRRDKGFIVPGTGDEEGAIPEEWFSGLDKKSLHHFLSQKLDWLVVAVPLTKDTTKFLSTEEFRVLAQGGGKTKPYVTNIARGQIIDQPALVEALKDGTLGGAALDVTDPEPLPKDSELWDMENVIITPHVSGATAVYIERAFQVLEENLRRRANGERLINLVDRDRGY